MDTDSFSSEAYFFKYIFQIYFLYEDSAYDTFWAFIIMYVINSVCFLSVLKFHSFRRHFQSLSPEVRCCGLDFPASRFLLHVLLPLEFFFAVGDDTVLFDSSRGTASYVRSSYQSLFNWCEPSALSCTKFLGAWWQLSELTVHSTVLLVHHIPASRSLHVRAVGYALIPGLQRAPSRGTLLIMFLTLLGSRSFRQTVTSF